MRAPYHLYIFDEEKCSKNAGWYIFYAETTYPPGVFEKVVFRQKYTNGMSIYSVFDGDHESVITFCESMYVKTKLLSRSAFWHIIQDISII